MKWTGCLDLYVIDTPRIPSGDAADPYDLQAVWGIEISSGEAIIFAVPSLMMPFYKIGESYRAPIIKWGAWFGQDKNSVPLMGMPEAIQRKPPQEAIETARREGERVFGFLNPFPVRGAEP
jgi:hypothetical protein